MLTFLPSYHISPTPCTLVTSLTLSASKYASDHSLTPGSALDPSMTFRSISQLEYSPFALHLSDEMLWSRMMRRLDTSTFLVVVSAVLPCSAYYLSHQPVDMNSRPQRNSQRRQYIPTRFRLSRIISLGVRKTSFSGFDPYYGWSGGLYWIGLCTFLDRLNSSKPFTQSQPSLQTQPQPHPRSSDPISVPSLRTLSARSRRPPSSLPNNPLPHRIRLVPPRLPPPTQIYPFGSGDGLGIESCYGCGSLGGLRV